MKIDSETGAAFRNQEAGASIEDPQHLIALMFPGLLLFQLKMSAKKKLRLNVATYVESHLSPKIWEWKGSVTNQIRKVRLDTLISLSWMIFEDAGLFIMLPLIWSILRNVRLRDAGTVGPADFWNVRLRYLRTVELADFW